MFHFFTNFTYLTLSLTLLIILCFGLFISKPEQRRLILLSGLLSVPTSLSSFVFVPDYWDPVRIIDFAVGPEDFIFSFSTGGLIWLITLKFLPKDLLINLRKKKIIRRYLKFILIGCFVYLIILCIDIGIMQATILTVCIIGLWIIYKNKAFIKISLYGLVGFSILYISIIKFTFSIFPFFLEQWNHDNMLGILIWGIPFEEIAWAISCGAVWPLIISYLFDVQFT